MIAVVPALANAIAHAIGKRFYDLPITPEKIRGALA
jgi:CO/xanthine dehydrogenase Mo-binding subunit